MSRNPDSKARREYVEMVKRINEIRLDLNNRVRRCNYLHSRFKTLKTINPEQAEAYVARIILHKPRIIEANRLIAELEDQLASMPQRWII